MLGSHSDGSQSDKEQVFDALPLIITKSIWSGGHGSSLQREKVTRLFLQEEQCASSDKVIYLMTGPN